MKGIKKVIEKTGLKYRFVCASIGVTEATLRNWDIGATIPKFTMIELLADTLHMSVDDLIVVVRLANET